MFTTNTRMKGVYLNAQRRIPRSARLRKVEIQILIFADINKVHVHIYISTYISVYICICVLQTFQFVIMVGAYLSPP